VEDNHEYQYCYDAELAMVFADLGIKLLLPHMSQSCPVLPLHHYHPGMILKQQRGGIRILDVHKDCLLVVDLI
jgi:hypothetical protein